MTVENKPCKPKVSLIAAFSMVNILINVKHITGYDDFSGQIFRIFEIIMFCFVVAICELVHDMETIFHLSYVLQHLEIFSEI